MMRKIFWLIGFSLLVATVCLSTAPWARTLTLACIAFELSRVTEAKYLRAKKYSPLERAWWI